MIRGFQCNRLRGVKWHVLSSYKPMRNKVVNQRLHTLGELRCGDG